MCEPSRRPFVTPQQLLPCFRRVDRSRTIGIADFDQIEALGWCRRAAGAAVAGIKGAGDVVGVPAPEPDELQGARYVAHLVVEKRARLCGDMDLIAGAG